MKKVFRFTLDVACSSTSVPGPRGSAPALAAHGSRLAAHGDVAGAARAAAAARQPERLRGAVHEAPLERRQARGKVQLPAGLRAPSGNPSESPQSWKKRRDVYMRPILVLAASLAEDPGRGHSTPSNTALRSKP